MPYHADVVLDFLEGEITSVYECLKYLQLCDKLQMHCRFEKESFVSEFQNILQDETESMDLDYAEDLLKDVKDIRNIAPDLVSDDDFDSIKSKVIELSAENDAMEQYDEDEYIDRMYTERNSKMESIDEMFGSLRQS